MSTHIQVKLIYNVSIPFESAFLDNGSFSLNHAEYVAMDKLKTIHTHNGRMIDFVIETGGKRTKIPLTQREQELYIDLKQSQDNIKRVVMEYGS